MFRETKAWLRWLRAVIKWRYYSNLYDFKEWLAVNGVCKFERRYTRQDVMRLGLLADLGRYTPELCSKAMYNRLKRRCEKLEEECRVQAELLESIHSQIGGAGYGSYRLRNFNSSLDGA